MSLAKAAELAGISIREMIPIAYAHGLEPKYDESLDELKYVQKEQLNKEAQGHLDKLQILPEVD